MQRIRPPHVGINAPKVVAVLRGHFQADYRRESPTIAKGGGYDGHEIVTVASKRATRQATGTSRVLSTSTGTVSVKGARLFRARPSEAHTP